MTDCHDPRNRVYVRVQRNVTRANKPATRLRKRRRLEIEALEIQDRIETFSCSDT